METLSSLPSLPTKRAEKKYYEPASRFKYLYSHPFLGFLVVLVANEQDRKGQSKCYPQEKDAKRLLDLLGPKV